MVTPPPAPPPVVRRARIETASLPTVPPKAMPKSDKFSGESLAKYGRKLHGLINARAQRTYPRQSKRRGEQGLVLIRVRIDPRGQLLSIDVADKSEAPARLARAAIKAVQSAAPFPQFVTGMNDQPTFFEVPIHYRLK